MHQGLFVVFEGGDGVGKSTQVEWLAASLEQAGVPHLVTFEPGATWLGERVRDIVLNPASGPICASAEALLYMADKAQHLTEVVEPALAAGKVVVCDRYIDSVIAYQGAGRGLGESIERLTAWATGGRTPELTVLLDADPGDAVATIVSQDRLESAGLALHARARQRFLDIAARDPGHHMVLPARQSRAAIAGAVRGRLADFGLKLSAPRGMVDA